MITAILDHPGKAARYLSVRVGHAPAGYEYLVKLKCVSLLALGENSFLTPDQIQKKA